MVKTGQAGKDYSTLDGPGIGGIEPHLIIRIIYMRNPKWGSREHRIIFEAMKNLHTQLYEYIKWEIWRIVPANTGDLWRSLMRSISKAPGSHTIIPSSKNPIYEMYLSTNLLYARYVNELPEYGRPKHIRHPPYAVNKYGQITYKPMQDDPDAETLWFNKLKYRGTMEAHRLYRLMLQELSMVLGSVIYQHFDIIPNQANMMVNYDGGLV